MSGDAPVRAESTEFHVAVLLAVAMVVYAAVLPALPHVLSEDIKALVGLDVPVSVGGSVALLAVSGLMVEQAVAARRSPRHGEAVQAADHASAPPRQVLVGQAQSGEAAQ